MAVLIFPAISSSNNKVEEIPNREIYKSIKKITGVSLKESFYGVTGKSIRSQDLLVNFALKNTDKEITDSLKEHQSSTYLFCQNNKMGNCDEQKAQMNKELDFIQGVYNKSKKGGDAALYWATILLSYKIRHNILKKHLEKWNKTCSAPEKVNLHTCKVSFKSVNIFNDVASKISILAYQKFNKKPLDSNHIQTLKIWFRQYE